MKKGSSGTRDRRARVLGRTATRCIGSAALRAIANTNASTNAVANVNGSEHAATDGDTGWLGLERGARR
jgi:hypothetical protein